MISDVWQSTEPSTRARRQIHQLRHQDTTRARRNYRGRTSRPARRAMARVGGKSPQRLEVGRHRRAVSVAKTLSSPQPNWSYMRRESSTRSPTTSRRLLHDRRRHSSSVHPASTGKAEEARRSGGSSGRSRASRKESQSCATRLVPATVEPVFQPGFVPATRVLRPRCCSLRPPMSLDPRGTLSYAAAAVQLCRGRLARGLPWVVNR